MAVFRVERNKGYTVMSNHHLRNKELSLKAKGLLSQMLSVAQKMTGALVFDERTDRYDIRFDLNSYYGGLHCGECFDVFVRGKWKPTRIEYGDNWYLVGIRAEDLNGLRVRI